MSDSRIFGEEPRSSGRTSSRSLRGLRGSARDRSKTRGLTDAELQTLPYLKEERAKQEKEFSLWTPLEAVFDLLSRGQYMTANVGEDIARVARGEDVNILEGLWKGITGERKGDWKTTLFGGRDEGERGDFSGMFEETPDWMDATADIPILGEIGSKDVIGFIANMLLDPTTYISFGATKAGKKAAQNYTEHAVKSTMRSAGNLDEIAKFTRKGFDVDNYAKLIATNEKKAAKYLSAYATKKDMARFHNNIVKTAQKEAMQMTAKEAQEKLIKNALKNKDDFIEKASRGLAEKKDKKAVEFLEETFGSAELAPGMRGLVDYEDTLRVLKDPNTTTDQAQAVYKRLFGQAGGLDLTDTIGGGRLKSSLQTAADYTQEVERMYSDEFMQQFKGMGERATLDFFGKEIGKYQYKPTAITRTYDAFMKKLGGSAVGKKFSDAAWSIMNSDKSPVGWIRKAFGIRNPYQKLLRVKQMNTDYLFRELASKELNEVSTIFKGLDKDVSRKVRDVLMEFEGQDLGDVLNPDVLRQFDIKEEQVDQVRKLFANVREYTSKLNKVEKGLIDQGLLDEYQAIENYLPIVSQQKIAGGKPRAGQTLGMGFTKDKTFTAAQRAAMDQARIKMITGLDDETVRTLVMEKNWGTLNMDLEEMLMHRGLAHAQAVKHGEFIKQFREFGVNFKDQTVRTSRAFDKFDDVDVEYSTDLMAAMRMNPNMMPEIGLSTVKSPGFEGYMFDKDVAEIIDRVNPIIGSDKGMSAFNKTFSKMSAFWRATATLSPGFHMRNAKSNVFTLYMKDGLKAFNPIRAKDSTIAAAHALGEDKFLKLIPKAEVDKVLNKRVGNKSIREWAEYARTKGVISQSTMGFDFADTVESFTKKKPLTQALSPFDTENVVFSASKRFGAVVESAPKFSSFLNDVENLAKYGDYSENSADWAIQQAKKWFFDYEDLTDFERNVMKKVIPFYTWVRKNLALQMTQIAEKRGTLSQFAKLTNLQRDETIDREDIPEWARSEGYIAMGEGEEGKTRFLDPGLPYGDLNMLPVRFEMVNGIPIPKLNTQDAVDEFLGMADPMIKTFAAMTSEKGYDPFRKRDLNSTAPAPRAMRLLQLAPGVMPVLDSMLKGIGVEKGLNASKNKKGELVIDAKIAYLLENNVLLLKRLGQMESSLSTIFPEIEMAIEKSTGFKEDAKGIDKLFKTLSFLLGYGQKDIDLDLEEGYRFREALKKAEESRAEENRKQPGYTKSLDKYIKAREAKIKRYKSRL